MSIHSQALAAKIAVIATRPDCPVQIQSELLKLVVEVAVPQGVEKGVALDSRIVLEIRKARDAGMTISEVAELLSMTRRQVHEAWPVRSRLTKEIYDRIFDLRQNADPKFRNERIAEELAISSGTVSRVLRGLYKLDGEG